MSDNPFDFFKYIFVVNLKEHTEKRDRISKMLTERGCKNFTIFEAVNGKKHPTLKDDYIKRNIITSDAFISPGGLGCLASHRTIWEIVHGRIDSDKPFWTLVFEDDANFHPYVTNEIFMDYIRKIPLDATFIKFGHHLHVDLGLQNKNKYWRDASTNIAYGTYCYAIHSTILHKILLHNSKYAVDVITINKGYYTANNPEDIYNLNKDDYKTWREYNDPYRKTISEYEGIIGCETEDSTTYSS